MNGIDREALIRAISASGDRYGSELERLCNECGLLSLREASDEQLLAYVRKHRIPFQGQSSAVTES